MGRKLLSVILLGLFFVPAHGQECRMSRAFMQPDINSPSGTGRMAVWADTSAESLFFIESLEVNMDGTRRSYSVVNFWGKRVAINTRCNAMRDACVGLNSAQLRARRVILLRPAKHGTSPAASHPEAGKAGVKRGGRAYGGSSLDTTPDFHSRALERGGPHQQHHSGRPGVACKCRGPPRAF